MRKFEFFLSFILFEKYMYDERNIKMHVHIDGKIMRRFLVIGI